jgi:UDP-2,4-diacetamido-2,4,6-trideoxy-beta-L-altropyranose hydrolase
LIVRADGDGQIGSGHLVRCGALADAWLEAGGAVTLVSHSPAALVRRVANPRIDVVDLDARHPDESDLHRTLGILEALPRGPRPWVVLDGYHFDDAYRTAIRAGGARVMQIHDDLESLPDGAEVVLNQNIGADQQPHRSAKALLLLGTRYALLRSVFARRAREPREVPARARQILVTLGGADPDNVTLTAVRAAARAARGNGGLELAVVLGSVNANGAEIRAAAEQTGCAVRVLQDVDAGAMADLMLWADAAVAAGGSTCWELACLGVPSLLVAVSDNQRGNVRGLGAAGAAVDLGDVADLTADRITCALEALRPDGERRREMAATARLLVDGGGADRVARLLAELSSDDPIGGRLTVRYARPADTLALWRLANDPIVRDTSFETTTIPLDTHLAWYRERLASPNVRFWVAEIEGAVAAVARYERIDADTAELYYAVVGPFRRRGVGAAILEATCDRACAELGVVRIQGVVLVYNSASMRALLRAGFSLTDKRRIHGQPCLVYERPVGGGAVPIGSQQA